MSQFADGLKQGLSFIIKNVAPQGKRLKFFNQGVANGSTLDLMQIPGVSEDDIKASILKGDLGRKLNQGYIQIVSSTLSFESVDAGYTSILTGYGLSASASSPGSAPLVDNVAGLGLINDNSESDGAERRIKSVAQNFILDKSSTLTANGITVLSTKSGVGRWIRQSNPSNKWTYQFDWYYNKDTGSDENDGATVTTPIKTLDELWRRIKVWSAGPNGSQKQYTVNLLSDVAPTDIFCPTGTIQIDGVQPNNTFIMPNFVGQRKILTVPGGSGALTAAATLPSTSTNSKGTLTDGYGVFTTLVGKMVMCADTATAASGSGAAASITTVASGIVTLTGGSGFTSASVKRLITISGAASGANNGTFIITRFISATSVEYHNPNAVASDANNGAISWVEKNAKISYITTAPTFTVGTGATVTAVSAGIATLANFPASTFTSAAVGMRIRMSGGLSANNGDFTILEVVSGTSIKIANINAVVDATVQNFQGVVEIGPTWFDNATLTQSASAPLSGSPYVVVQCTVVPSKPTGIGKPAGMRIQFTDCEMSTTDGLGTGMQIQLTTCQMTNGGLLAGGPNTHQPLQSEMFSNVCVWKNPSAGFGTLLFMAFGTNRFFDGLFIGYNLRYREGPVGPLVISNAMIQGGYLGPAGEEPGPRPGSASGWAPQGPRGLAIFNNVENSLTNPASSTGSQGFALVMTRETRGTCSGLVWGVGALGGIHIKENSRLMTIPTVTHKITDGYGLAGYAVQEIKFDNQPGMPVLHTTTGVPTAVTTTSGSAATFTATNGIVTVVDAGATFTTASVGRTITFVSQNNSANNGTFVIVEFVSATSVKIRNTAGVTDAVSAGTWTENPVITRWAQLVAAPYSGNATSYLTGSRAYQIVGS